MPDRSTRSGLHGDFVVELRGAGAAIAEYERNRVSVWRYRRPSAQRTVSDQTLTAPVQTDRVHDAAQRTFHAAHVGDVVTVGEKAGSRAGRCVGYRAYVPAVGVGSGEMVLR